MQDKHGTIFMTQKNKIETGLPLIALCLDFVPVLLVLIGSLIQGLSSFALLFMILSPIAGLMTGIISLNKGKDRIGVIGRTLAIIAVTLPLALIVIILIFFIGAATGLISLM